MIQTQQQNTINTIESFSHVLDSLNTIAIYGNTGSGKTALAYAIIEKINKPVYFLFHPQPRLLQQFGYSNITNFAEVEHLQDCVLYWDEPQLHELSQYKCEKILIKLMSLARQRNITFIFSTSETRTFTARVEAYIQLWLIKDIEYSMTKQRSFIRQIIRQNTFIEADGFSLNRNEFIAYCRRERINDKYNFNLIADWSESLSTSYRMKKEDEGQGER